jgi:hypothetical protein
VPLATRPALAAAAVLELFAFGLLKKPFNAFAAPDACRYPAPKRFRRLLRYQTIMHVRFAAQASVRLSSRDQLRATHSDIALRQP